MNIVAGLQACLAGWTCSSNVACVMRPTCARLFACLVRVRGVPEDKVINEVMLADQPTKKVRQAGGRGLTWRPGARAGLQAVRHGCLQLIVTKLLPHVPSCVACLCSLCAPRTLLGWCSTCVAPTRPPSQAPACPLTGGGRHAEELQGPPRSSSSSSGYYLDSVADTQLVSDTTDWFLATST
jgi:hypothetical protein